ncbi:MAG: SMP-30/gluconolactonase/LRE family protein [Chitinophagaceae bacterium]|nr:SMP-30/gluconolactonase/LRE family protein [Chitinophagaceae bacterium]
MNKLFYLLVSVLLSNCSEKPTHAHPTTGQLITYDPEFLTVIDTSLKAEILTDSFDWSEGPLFLPEQGFLIFSDVPRNTIYKWTEEKGIEVYLTPSGYTDSIPSLCKEPGSNGLTLDPQGRLVLAQHGNRQVARMEAPLDKPLPTFTALADKFNGKRLSSPNDCVFNSAGELFFTDPPYGLRTQDDSDSAKELPFNGVYKVNKKGDLVLLVDSITRPNGIAFLPGEQQLLVANSDPAKPYWYIFDIAGDSLTQGRIFFDPSAHEPGWNGLPDGFKVNKKGIVIATGPGGIYFFTAQGKKLGLLRLENSASNCALSADEKTLYITNDMNLLRIALK